MRPDVGTARRPLLRKTFRVGRERPWNMGWIPVLRTLFFSLSTPPGGRPLRVFLTDVSHRKRSRRSTVTGSRSDAPLLFFGSGDRTDRAGFSCSFGTCVSPQKKSQRRRRTSRTLSCVPCKRQEAAAAAGKKENESSFARGPPPPPSPSSCFRVFFGAAAAVVVNFPSLRKNRIIGLASFRRPAFFFAVALLLRSRRKGERGAHTTRRE